MSERSRKPTDGMVEEAKRGLEWRREFGRGGTAVGVARARDISNRKELSPRTIARMRSFFARHEVDKKAEGFSPGEKGYPSNGRIAWALWGGDAGKAFADARAVTAAVEEPKRSSPDELTEAEIEQRREAGRKSGEARRARAQQYAESRSQRSGGRERGSFDFEVENAAEKRVKDIRKRLASPDTPPAEREQLNSQLQEEMADQRERRLQRAQAKRKLQKELARAREDYKRAERVFDVDAMNDARSRIDDLESQFSEEEIAEDVLKISKDMQREAEAAAARAAAEAKKAENARLAELKKFYSAIEKQRKEQEGAAKKAARAAESAQKKAASKAASDAKKAEAAAKKAEKEAAKAPKSVLTAEQQERYREIARNRKR